MDEEGLELQGAMKVLLATLLLGILFDSSLEGVEESVSLIAVVVVVVVEEDGVVAI